MATADEKKCNISANRVSYSNINKVENKRTLMMRCMSYAPTSQSQTEFSVESPISKSKSAKMMIRQQSRPENLRLPAGGYGSLPRRQSSTNVPDALNIPGYGQSPGSLRRYSDTCCPAAKSSSGKGTSYLQTGLVNTGRRNSAITYISDGFGGGVNGTDSSTVTAKTRCRNSARSSSTSSYVPECEEDYKIERSGRSCESVHVLDRHGTQDMTSLVPEDVQSLPFEVICLNSGLGSHLAYPVFSVLVLGGSGVGKTTLSHQLLTSEYLANSDTYPGMLLTLVYYLPRNISYPGKLPTKVYLIRFMCCMWGFLQIVAIIYRLYLIIG